jgi:hypothetical protein
MVSHPRKQYSENHGHYNPKVLNRKFGIFMNVFLASFLSSEIEFENMAALRNLYSAFCFIEVSTD